MKDTNPQSFIDGIEFFVMNGEIQFIQNGTWYLLHEMDLELAARIRKLIDSDPKAIRGLQALGITDYTEQMMKFIFCRFGDFDKKADFPVDGPPNTEYFDCGKRPCPADGLLCKTPAVKQGNLTPHDCNIIRKVTQDLPNKMIASLNERSVHTVNRELTNIAHKIGCETKAGIAFFAGQNNIM